MCKQAFSVALGLPYQPCNRINKLQSKANKGLTVIVWNTDNCGSTSACSRQCLAFLQNFALTNSEKSPVKAIIYVEPQPLNDLFRLYKFKYKPTECIAIRTFQNLWQSIFNNLLTDPDTHVVCVVKRKKIWVPGFKICNWCVALKLAISLAKGKAAVADSKADYRKHRTEVYKDKQEFLRIKDSCRDSETRVGATIDCPDRNKFAMPTTKNKAAVMGTMMKIKNKITAVEFFDSTRKLLFYRSLPDVRTGADLTMTVLMRMIDQGHLDKCVHFFLHVDGSSDNINYTFLKCLCHILVCAWKTHWPLKVISVLRQIPGKFHLHTLYTHTHTHTHTHRTHQKSPGPVVLTTESRFLRQGQPRGLSSGRAGLCRVRASLQKDLWSTA